MPLEIKHGESVEHLVYSQGPPNSHGKPSAVYTSTVIPGVGVDVPDVAETGLGSSNEQTIDAVIFLPAGMTASKMDQFLVRGKKYQVNGDAMAIKNFFTGAMFPTEVKLRRVSG